MARYQVPHRRFRQWLALGPAVSDSNGLLTILNFAFKMEPDVIFLISDGGYFATTAVAGTDRLL